MWANEDLCVQLGSKRLNEHPGLENVCWIQSKNKSTNDDIVQAFYHSSGCVG